MSNKALSMRWVSIYPPSYYETYQQNQEAISKSCRFQTASKPQEIPSRKSSPPREKTFPKPRECLPLSSEYFAERNPPYTFNASHKVADSDGFFYIDWDSMNLERGEK